MTSNLVEGATSPNPAARRPLVSVLIPAYNVEEFVAAAIESALEQTYPNVEVVVVNDGSTDGTAEVIAPYRDRIVYVDQRNRGLAGARNAAIGAASGTVLALLDADDLWLPDRLERCVSMLEQHPEIGLVTSDAYLIEDGVLTERRCYGDRRIYPFPGPDADQLDIISQRNFLFVSVVFRRALVDENGGFDETLPRAEDFELWTRLLLAGARAGYVPDPLGYYRRRADSLSASPDQWDAHLTVLERHLPELWRHGAVGRPRDLFEIGQRLARRGDRRGAARFFSHAVRAPGVPLGTRARYGGGALRATRPGTGVVSSLVLVVGAPRSGTTWMQALLGAQPGVVTPQETDLFTRYIRPLHEAWQWQLRGGPDDWGRRRFKGLPGVLTTDELAVIVRELIDELLAPVSTGSTTIVEKSPSHSLCADVVAAYVPETKVIHVVRDGRDVAASLNAAAEGWGRGWAPSSVAGAARSWRDHVQGARQYPDLGVAYHEVRYETLARVDVDALRDVYEFCGFDVDSEECARRYETARFDVMADGAHDPVKIGGEFAAHASDRVEPEGFFRRGANGGWREDWSATDRLAFDAVAGDLLVALGYETDPTWAADAGRARTYRAVAATRHAIGAAARRVGRLGEQIERRP